ncbi:MAG: hypothetical protein HRT66_11420 [Flavobacteriaceae bacterium]|nr:hypothetical protein [Flavobacteriaceae bacterium]
MSEGVNTYCADKLEDKQYFAAFFNSARNNFSLSINDLNTKFGLGVKGKDIDIINECFKDDITITDWDNRIRHLSQTLVFVKHLPSIYEDKDQGRAKLREVLCALYKLIEKKRNYYTHIYHQEINYNADDIKLIEDDELMYLVLFFNAKSVKNMIKNNKDYNDFVTSKHRDDIYDIIKEAEDDGLDLKGNETVYAINSLFNDYIEKIDGIDKCSEYIDKDMYDIQLLALFLNKKDTTNLLNHTEGLKDNRSLITIVNRWVVSNICYRDIRNLLRSEYSKDSLLMEMVAELSKCPKELYGLLLEKDRGDFDFEREDGNGVSINRRYDSKFPYFALRFVDGYMDMPSLRFQINVGKYNKDSREKDLHYSIANNPKKTTRDILKKITVFDKLSNVTKLKHDYFKKENNSTDKSPPCWLEYPNPSYQYNGNNIGVYLKGYTSENIAPKYDDYMKELGGGEFNKLEAEAYLSFNELPSIIYAFFTNKKKGKFIESKINARININKGSNPINQPKKLKLYKENEEILLVSKIVKEINIEINHDELKYIRSKYTREVKRENELSSSEKGKIATWLAYDIKRFMSKDKRKDWKGYQFSEFQSLLAKYAYGDYKKDFKGFIKNNFGLEHSNNFGLPFKGIDFSKETLFNFYNGYKIKRKAYLEGILNEINNEDNLNNESLQEKMFVFLNKKNYVIRRDYKDNLSKSTMNLGRGLFDEKQTYIKGDKDSNNIADWFKCSNESVKQSFYSYDKTYSYKEDGKQKIVTDKGLTEQYNNDLPTEIQKLIYKNEASIRKMAREDYYTLEMVKHILLKEYVTDSNGVESVDLSNVFKNKQEIEDIKEKSDKQSTRDKLKKGEEVSDNVINDSYLLNHEIELVLRKGKIKGKVKLKNINKYRDYEYDKKVKFILSYLPRKSWTIKEIEEELSSYEKVRLETFFGLVHSMEKVVYDCNTELKDEIMNGREIPNFKSDVFKGESSDMIELRNAFCHDVLPEKDVFERLNKTSGIEENETIGEYLCRMFKAMSDSHVVLELSSAVTV